MVKNDQSQALNQLHVTYAPKVTQYPVGPLCDFLSEFDVTGCKPATAVDFDAKNLLFLKFQFNLPSTFLFACYCYGDDNNDNVYNDAAVVAGADGNKNGVLTTTTIGAIMMMMVEMIHS